MPPRPSKRRRTAAGGCAAPLPPPHASGPADAVLNHMQSATSERGGVQADAVADPSLLPPSHQQPGELQAACAAELATAPSSGVSNRK